MREVSLSHVDPDSFLAQRDDLATIHQEAFGETHDRARHYQDVDLPEMACCRGFHAVVAHEDDRLVGFVVGYDATAIPRWYRNVSRAVQGTSVATWFPEAWYLADIAVHPDWQRSGIGTRLHDAIMPLVADRACMLITFHGDHPAKRLYARLGWHETMPDLAYYPGGPLTSLLEYGDTMRR
ncbi:MAG TPA: GNAT family N-acetyltransferase [Thermomicrobiales bacterium]|nr:GNAT family N-acetyltransferase [Thermomicrobiales bacterium]